MSAHTVVRQEMPVGIEETFHLLHDYPARLTWDTLLRRAETVDGVPPGRVSKPSAEPAGASAGSASGRATSPSTGPPWPR
jgi:hypothetical protein